MRQCAVPKGCVQLGRIAFTTWTLIKQNECNLNSHSTPLLFFIFNSGSKTLRTNNSLDVDEAVISLLLPMLCSILKIDQPWSDSFSFYFVTGAPCELWLIWTVKTVNSVSYLIFTSPAALLVSHLSVTQLVSSALSSRSHLLSPSLVCKKGCNQHQH